jgi:hypothetical protein
MVSPGLDAAHVEAPVPEGLFLGRLAPRAGPVVGALNGRGGGFRSMKAAWESFTRAGGGCQQGFGEVRVFASPG